MGSHEGPPGLDGLSAYELARAHGFVGTLVQWLDSLKGERGAAGQDGRDGRDGLDGAPGADGKHGRDGKDGKDGLRGEPGLPGKSAPALAPAVAYFDRDSMGRTKLVRVVSAQVELHITPQRNADGVMQTATIQLKKKGQSQ